MASAYSAGFHEFLLVLHRHKIVKRSLYFIFIIIVAFAVIILLWFHSNRFQRHVCGVSTNWSSNLF